MLTKPRIKLDFVDFWPGFRKDDNYFYDLLSREYDVLLCRKPDYLIASCFGNRSRRYRCVRILFLGENLQPDMTAWDYVFSSNWLDHPRHYRLPLFAVHAGHAAGQLSCYSGGLGALVKGAQFDAEQVLQEKSGFCSFLVSNGNCPERNTLFRKLCRYKLVDSGGVYFNNIGKRVENKLEWLRKYKFTICYENSLCAGYTTEKLFDAMYAKCVGIYWGDPTVGVQFNSNSFVNAHEFANCDAVIDRVIELDQDDRRYLEVLQQPYFRDNAVPATITPEAVLGFFRTIFATS